MSASYQNDSRPPSMQFSDGSLYLGNSGKTHNFLLVSVYRAYKRNGLAKIVPGLAIWPDKIKQYKCVRNLLKKRDNIAVNSRIAGTNGEHPRPMRLKHRAHVFCGKIKVCSRINRKNPVMSPRHLNKVFAGG